MVHFHRRQWQLQMRLPSIEFPRLGWPLPRTGGDPFDVLGGALIGQVPESPCTPCIIVFCFFQVEEAMPSPRIPLLR